MIKYLIIDDEYVAHDIIKSYCDLLPNMELTAHCYDTIEAIDYLSKHSVDLIFLDLNMPKLKGFEFLKTLTSPPNIIVTTAYSEFALEGYELNILDYLLKPFSFERFLKAVNKITVSNHTKTTATISVDKTISNHIFLKQNKSFVQVDIATVLYLEASGNYTKVITKSDIITIREKISDILKLLPKNEFLQVHKSFAVSKKRIKKIEGNRIHIDKHMIPIGKLYKINVNDLLNS